MNDTNLTPDEKEYNRILKRAKDERRGLYKSESEFINQMLNKQTLDSFFSASVVREK